MPLVEDSPIRVDWEPSSHQTGSRSAIWQSAYRHPPTGCENRWNYTRAAGGMDGTTLRETGLSVIIVTNRGNWTGAVRKTPLMRVKAGDSYVLIGSRGAAPKNPEWVYNLRSDGNVQIREEAEVIHDARPRGRQCRRAGAVVGTWQWRRFHPTQSIVTGQRGGFLCSLQSRRDQTRP